MNASTGGVPLVPETIVQAVVLLVIMIVSLLGNLAVLFIIIHSYKMRTVTNFLIASLSLSDLIAACFLIPVTFVSVLGSLNVSRPVCIVYGSLTSLHAISSTVNVCVISVDRVLAISRPPGKRLTSKVCGIVVAILWSLALILSLPWFYTHSDFDTNRIAKGLNYCIFLLHASSTSTQAGILTWTTLISCHILPMSIMIYCWMVLWRTVRAGDMKIRPASVEPSVMIFLGEIHTAITVMIIIFIFICLWMPYLILALRRSLGQADTASSAEDAVCLTLAWITAAVKPILYICRNNHAAEVLRLRKPDNNNQCQNFLHLEVNYRTKMRDERNGVVSEEEIQPKFDWAVVSRSPGRWTVVSKSPTRFLVCGGGRKNSDLEMFTNMDKTERRRTEGEISTINSIDAGL